MRDDRPWDDSVDNPPDSRLVTIAHACFDFARAGDTKRLRAYVEHGVPVNLTDATGNTLLMLAAYHGHPKTVRDLVALGADPDRTNDRGQSPLAGAIFSSAVPRFVAGRPARSLGSDGAEGNGPRFAGLGCTVICVTTGERPIALRVRFAADPRTCSG